MSVCSILRGQVISLSLNKTPIIHRSCSSQIKTPLPNPGSNSTASLSKESLEKQTFQHSKYKPGDKSKDEKVFVETKHIQASTSSDKHVEKKNALSSSRSKEENETSTLNNAVSHSIPSHDITTKFASEPFSEDQNAFFSRVLKRFPQHGRCLSLTYGSAVFKQANRTDKDKERTVTDFILVVEDPESWHKENVARNKSDYSSVLRLLGPKLIAENQDKWGARLHFNTLVPFENGLIKYGVISKSAFLCDCLDWEHLYAAGRLHKPVRILEMEAKSDWELKMALRMNLQSALHTALLLLPETFTEEDLYLKLAGLSYAGDFRMVVGEDKNKVANIVMPSISLFRKLYAHRLRTLSDYVEVLPFSGQGHQDTSPSGRHYHLSQLPRALQWNLVLEWNRHGSYRDVEEVLRAAAYDRDSDEIITKALQSIVQRSSITQAVKGVLTAGMLKTVKYSAAKLQKMIKSLGKSK